MPRDALAVLWRLRDIAVAKAREHLAEALVAEKKAMLRLEAHRHDIQREQSDAADEDIVAFARWLPHARQQAECLQKALHIEKAKVSFLRQALVTRRIEAEAVAKARQRRDAEASLITSRREQAIMDEAASNHRRGTVP